MLAIIIGTEGAAIWAAIQADLLLLFHYFEAANSRANHHPNCSAFRSLITNPASAKRLLTGRHPELREPIHPLGFFTL
ncbi:MAG: hypothetical protein EDM05_000435 (plasmid) [Leptolyngbya sp. IPPAS B-1204]